MMGVASYAEGQAVADPQCIPTGTGDTALHTLTMIITAATLDVWIEFQTAAQADIATNTIEKNYER